MSDKNFVFVCGLNRSGTSLFAKVLKEQYDFTGFEKTGVLEDEGMHLQSVFYPALAYGGAGRFSFDKNAYLNEESKLITDANKTKLLAEWGDNWNMSKKFMIEKSPPNLIRSRFLQEMFDQTYFIAILRHPIAVSFATQKWSHTSLNNLFAHWLVAHRIFEEDRKHLKNVLVLQYEHFVLEPESVMKKVSEFLKTQIVIPDKITIKSSVNDKYFDMWESYKNNFIKRPYLKYLIEKYEESFNYFGYSLENYRHIK